MGISVTTFIFIILVSQLVFYCAVCFGNVEVGRGGRYMDDVVEGKYVLIGTCRSRVVFIGL